MKIRRSEGTLGIRPTRDVFTRTWRPIWIGIILVASAAGGFAVSASVPDTTFRLGFGVLGFAMLARSLFLTWTRITIDWTANRLLVESGPWIGILLKRKSLSLDSIHSIAYRATSAGGANGEAVKSFTLFAQHDDGQEFVLFPTNAIPFRPERTGRELADQLGVEFRTEVSVR